MTARTLLHLVLKIIGLFFVRDMFLVIPAITSLIYTSLAFDSGLGLSTFIISIVTLGFYGAIIYFLLFKTNWLIDVLKLEENFPEDPVPFNIHRSTVLSISVIVVGLLLVTQSVPLLVKELAGWYRHTRAQTGFLRPDEPFEYSMLLVYCVEVLIGILFLNYHRTIVNFIEYKRRTVTTDTAD